MKKLISLRVPILMFGVVFSLVSAVAFLIFGDDFKSGIAGLVLSFVLLFLSYWLLSFFLNIWTKNGHVRYVKFISWAIIAVWFLFMAMRVILFVSDFPNPAAPAISAVTGFIIAVLDHNFLEDDSIG